MVKKEHNTLADESFREAEGHANAGHHKNMWHSLSQAQTHALNHAKTLAEDGKHGAALAYRKMVMARVADVSRRLDSTKVEKAISDFQMSKYSALAAVWDVMKRQQPGWQKFKYLIPQVELAKTSDDVDSLLERYGIKLNREIQKSEELRKENWHGDSFEPKFHGWISHTGKYHPIKEGQSHRDVLIVKPHILKHFGQKGWEDSKQYKRLIDDNQKPKGKLKGDPYGRNEYERQEPVHDPHRYLYDKGWILTGMGAEHVVQGSKHVLDNPHHPATKKLAEQWGKTEPSWRAGSKRGLLVMRDHPDKVHDVGLGGKHNEHKDENWVPPHKVESGDLSRPRSMVSEFHNKKDWEE